MRRRVAVIPASVLLALVLALPGGAAVQERVSVPPQLERAPDDALYVEPRFSYAMTAGDVVYGQNWNVDGELQDLLLDVYEPVGHDEQFRPVIVWATGGGFIRAPKDNLYFAPWLLERGYVVVSIDYRVRPDLPYAFFGYLSDPVTLFPEFVAAMRDAQHDMQAAVRWVRANAADLRVDPTRIVVAGYSAGGFMALLTNFNSDDPGDSGSPGWPSHVAAAVSGGGGYGPGIQGTITPGEPPIAIFHGAQDDEVPIVAALPPCANTIAMGNVCEAHVYPNETHNMSRPALWPDVAAESADFLWRYVISAERTETRLTGLSAVGQGGTATVRGRLVAEDDTPLLGGERPLAGQRVLARATAGWVETRTGLDGRFTLEVPAPDHGRSTDVLVRYDGQSTGSWLVGTDYAPTADTVPATWGGGPPA